MRVACYWVALKNRFQHVWTCEFWTTTLLTTNLTSFAIGIPLAQPNLNKLLNSVVLCFISKAFKSDLSISSVVEARTMTRMEV